MKPFKIIPRKITAKADPKPFKQYVNCMGNANGVNTKSSALCEVVLKNVAAFIAVDRLEKGVDTLIAMHNYKAGGGGSVSYVHVYASDGSETYKCEIIKHTDKSIVFRLPRKPSIPDHIDNPTFRIIPVISIS